MRRGKPCPICSDAQLLLKVNALLAAGEMPTAVSRLTGILKDRINRHRRHAFPQETAPAVPGNELEVSDERLRLWADRIESCWNLGVAEQDQRRLLESLKSGVRLALEMHKRAEQRQQQAGPFADPAAPFGRNANGDALLITRELGDMLLKQHDEQVALFSLMPCPCCNDFKNGEMYTSNPGFLRRWQAAQVEKMLKGVTISGISGNSSTAGDSAGVTTN